MLLLVLAATVGFVAGVLLMILVTASRSTT